MNAVDDALFFLSRPRVIHALPGRLRLHVPSLKRWGHDHDELVSLVARLLTTPEGIYEVSPCVITGNVLILYDVDQLSENELVAFLASLLQIFKAHNAKLLQTQQVDLPVVEKRLRQWLSKSLSHRLYLDRGLRIPEDVFQ